MTYTEENCSLTDFIAHVSNQTDPADVPYAAMIEKKVPTYDAQAIRAKFNDPAFRVSLKEELAFVLQFGAGIFVLRKAFPDLAPVDDATTVFNEIINNERNTSGGNDHFAKAGANDRIWNALEKLCLKAPDVFARYYANDMIALASESWLGPGYQVTSQINVVRPGGDAQKPHCDFHLGFQTAERTCQYPAHVHQLSSALTLQGAIAHCDMPVESGPTKILPFSQTYPARYVAWRREDFAEYFEDHSIQLPLDKGDALFFNPSLFHASGANRTSGIARMANLLQISSAFGRAMEGMDRAKMGAALFPVLRTAFDSGQMTNEDVSNAIASCAEGYPFPTNLDHNPPVGGLAPETQQQIMLSKFT